jgi:hypothetical protein
MHSPRHGGARCCDHGLEHQAINMEEQDLPHMWPDPTRMATDGQESILKICRGCGGNREGLRRRENKRIHSQDLQIEPCNSTVA